MLSVKLLVHYFITLVSVVFDENNFFCYCVSYIKRDGGCNPKVHLGCPIYCWGSIPRWGRPIMPEKAWGSISQHRLPQDRWSWPAIVEAA